MRIWSRVLLSIVGLLSMSSPTGALPVHSWSQRFGDGNPQNATAVALDASGNVIVTGYFQGTLDFGGGPLTTAPFNNDIFLAKFDANGNHQWSRKYGAAGHQYSSAVATSASGDVLVTGSFDGTIDFGGGALTNVGAYDIFLAKLGPDAGHLWSRRFGGSQFQSATDVEVDDAGNIVITGSFGGTIDFGGGPLTSAGLSDIFVAKFDAAGNHMWSRRFGDLLNQGALDIETDSANSVVVSGGFDGTVNFGGGDLTSAGGADIFLAKFGSDGSHIWSKGFGDPDYQYADDVEVDVSGNVWTVGILYGTVDFGGGPLTDVGGGDAFLAKFDQNGTHLWSARYGDGESQIARSITADGSGGVWFTGFFYGTLDLGGPLLTSAGWDDFYVAHLDGDGNHVWSERFGDAGTQGQETFDLFNQSITSDAAGNVVTAGGFAGTIDWGGDPLAANYIDVFVAKFVDAPVPVMITSFVAIAFDAAILLRWELWSDESLESIALYRRDDLESPPIVIADLDAGSARSFVDHNVIPGKTYHYELVVRTHEGLEFRSPIAVAEIPLPITSLGQNYPNPFNPETSIPFTLASDGHVSLRVYDVSGRLVANLLDESRDAGHHIARWDGRAQDGVVVTTGVYFARLYANGSTYTRKLMVLK